MVTHQQDDPQLRAALERLFSLQTFGIKLGLDPIAGLLEEIGNPHLQMPMVHIAGTNGKGSVCTMVASALQAAGLRVGLYTSPHILHFTERIRVNGEPMPRDVLARYAQEMLPLIERHNCTFFEGTTAIGFRYFAEQQVDIAVIETGLGGRLDATNVITPLVSAVTSIGYDHVKHLGDTLEKIAMEKAGIFKPGVPAVVGHVAPRLRPLFREHAEKTGTTVRFVDEFCRSAFRRMSIGGTVASFLIDHHEIADLHIDLIGKHQIANAQVALGVLDALRAHYPLSEDDLRRGFASLRGSTGIRGRFEIISDEPRIILDVAHNPDGMEVLIDTLRALGIGFGRKIRVVFGAVEDKDVAEIGTLLAPISGRLYAVRADNYRSLPAEDIEHQIAPSGIPVTVAGTVEAGIRMALEDAGPDDVVLICGSFYVVADAIAAFDAGALPAAPIIAEPKGTGGAQQSQQKGDEGDTGILYQPFSPLMGQKKKRSRIPLPDDDTAEKEESPERRATVKEWSPSEQPRERLMQLGPKALSDAELLAILLRTGTRQEDVIQVSRNILHRFRNLSQLAMRDYRELQEIVGIGPTKAVTLAAAFEIGRRTQAEPFMSRPVISSPRDVARIYVPLLRGVSKEQFHVLILNSANQVIRMGLVSEGSLNSSIVHPREVFRIAIVENAASIIGLHNHPSGNPTPSREDINITRQLVEAGKIVGIPFHDHIIVAGEEFVSMAERGYL